MPHVVVVGDVCLRTLHEEFEPFEQRVDGTVLKIQDSFLSHERSLVLLDCLVFDRRPKSFLMMLDQRDDRVSVRLYPPTDPEKCDGVRRLIAAMAWRLRRRFPATRYDATNLDPFLIHEDAVESESVDDA